MAIIFTAALIAAAMTQASSSVVGYFPLEICSSFECRAEEPNVFVSPGGAAVNGAGSGEASPGDVYIFDKGREPSFGRIQQFSASDQFIRLWGPGVVKSGPDNANEVQAVRVDATGGAFKLSFSGDGTADIAANATAVQVESALNALPSVGPGGVSVSGGPGGAGGTTPYIVSFEGSLAGAAQPLLKATNGGIPLSGGAATASTYTTVRGGYGFEICSPASGDECTNSNGGAAPDSPQFSHQAGLAGSLSSPKRIAVDQASGEVYVSNMSRIEAYSASGRFLRAWGQDVVASGPDDSAGPDETKSITVTADGGTFTLGYRPTFNATAERTPPIPFDATPAAVETALDNLAEIGGDYSSVSVTGGPGDLTGSNPYLITFHGQLGGDDIGEPLVSNSNGLTVSSGSKSIDIATTSTGGSYEICKAEDACKIGTSAQTAGAFGGEGPPSVAVAPATAPNAGDVLVLDSSNHRVEEFTDTGAFVRAFGWDVDATDPSTGFEVCSAASGHTCQAGTPGMGVGQFAFPSGLAEDSSGAIYTVEPRSQFGAPNNRVQKFTPAGGLALTPSLFGTDEIQALTVNAGAGQFYLSFGSEFNGTTGSGDVTAGSTTITNVSTGTGEFAVGQPVDIFGGGYPFPVGESIVAVGANTLTVSKPIPYTQAGRAIVSNRPYKTSDLPYDVGASEVESALNSLPSIGGESGSVSVSGGPGSAGGPAPYQIAFDGGQLAHTNPAPITAVAGATPLSGGSGPGANTASVAITTVGGPGGIRAEEAPFDIGIGPGDHVFVAKYFPLFFTTCADGSLSLAEARIQELDSSGTVIGTSDPCRGVGGTSDRDSSLTVNVDTGHPYFLGNGTKLIIFGPPGPAPTLALNGVSDVTATGGTISGTINPNGPGTSYPDTTGAPDKTRTTYRVEFKKASDSIWTTYTPDIPVGNGTSPAPFGVGVGGLAPNTDYELKAVAVKPFTADVEETKSFTTSPAGPEIEAFSSSNVTVDSADLRALINPRGTATSYHFEYGTTPAYGTSTAEISIGQSHQGEAVQNHIEGLQDTVYHFRVVATNASGTATSADQTFTFHPPVCPNQTVRQQTGAAYLPDCRAYELVSPEDAGGTTLVTGGPQSPYATNPSRLAFVGKLAAIPGSGRNPINTLGDLYVASRGAEGWRTRYIGPSSEEAGCVGGRPIVSGTGFETTIQNDVMADPGLSRIIDWNLGNPLECVFGAFGDQRSSDFNTAAVGSNAPYLWNAHGDFLDRWPTSAADVAGSETNFSCPQNPNTHPYPDGVVGNIPVPYFCSTYVDASKDLSHFVFSTQSGLYGEGGLTAAPGSAYDNDTVHNTLRLVSKLPNGEPIGQEPGAKGGPEELIQFPAISSDGSHILMGTTTKPKCKQLDYPRTSYHTICPIVSQPTHLYMRISDAITYDVSAGRPVKYIGATLDGTKVYFTSNEQLTGDDTDESTDLYMWSENGGGPQLTRISTSNTASAGNTDNCVSTWTTNCDIETYDDSTISTAIGNRGGLGSWTEDNVNPGYTDNAIAAKSGDIYFYSPEQLVAGKGAPGKENLYVHHAGSVRFVAALEDDAYCLPAQFAVPRCSNGAAGRLQVTPDGRYAAFITTSNITAYDSHGYAEMYRYDAEAEEVKCVSCRPDGSAPTGDVLGSEGGRFITDDGRVFFDTTEPLDPRDTNSGPDVLREHAGSDVYEFVEGRAQLITTGTGTGVPAQESRQVPGLYGVSANGADVYFGTFDTLVGQDRNGEQMKFYDARTNGGFAFVPPPAPCAAADECHGPSSSPPSALAGGTGIVLGAEEIRRKPTGTSRNPTGTSRSTRNATGAVPNGMPTSGREVPDEATGNGRRFGALSARLGGDRPSGVGRGTDSALRDLALDQPSGRPPRPANRLYDKERQEAAARRWDQHSLRLRECPLSHRTCATWPGW